MFKWLTLDYQSRGRASDTVKSVKDGTCPAINLVDVNETLKSSGKIWSKSLLHSNRTDWRELEEIVRNLFMDMGCSSEVTQSQKDGGVDVVAKHPDDHISITQVKNWKDNVSKSDIKKLAHMAKYPEELQGALPSKSRLLQEEDDISEVIFVSSGDFASPAIDHAKNVQGNDSNDIDVRLINGEELSYLLNWHSTFHPSEGTPPFE